MRILVSDDVSEKGVAILREHFDVDVKTNMPPEELLACIGESRWPCHPQPDAGD